MRGALCILLAATAACSSDSGGDDVDPTCGNGSLDMGEQCDDGNTNDFDGCRADCTMVEPLSPTPMTWQYFEIAGTKCIDGTPAGFSVNYNPASTKLAIYLEGGGACFNSFCEQLFSRGPNQPTIGGIFDRQNAANPIADWTWVYIPYCSGDVYGGAAETMVGNKLRTFNGYGNITSFLAHIVPSFEADQVLLSGASAGGFGAAVNFAQTQRAFGDVPVVLVDDSGPPMSGEVFPPCLQQLWKTTWGLDKTLVAECGSDCDGKDAFIATAFDSVRREFPTMTAGLFSSTGDQTIRTFAGYGWAGGYDMCGNIPNAVTQQAYQAGLEELRTNAASVGTGFGTFYIGGSSHTILRSSQLYTTMSGGMTVPQWITGLLGGTAANVGP